MKGLDYPRIVFWELTKKCNLFCLHCRASSPEISKSTDLSQEQIFEIMDKIVRVASPLLVLTGGEPLFREDIRSIVHGAKERGLRVAIATNGTIVDELTALWMKGEGVEKVSISLDGLKEVHDRIRGIEGAFDGAVNGMRSLVKAGVPVQINMTLLKENMNEMERMARFVIDEGGVGLHIFMLVPVGCGLTIPEERLLSPIEYESLLHSLLDLSIKNPGLDIRATCAPQFYRIVRQKKELLENLEKEQRRMLLSRGCLAGTGVIFISHKGVVQPCGYLPLPLGDLTRDDFEEIWIGSPVLNHLRDPDRLKGKCGLCEFKLVCFGCRARAFQSTGDFMEEEPFCIYLPRSSSGVEAMI